MTCREIADEFIFAVEWFDVTPIERLNLIMCLERYPLEPLIVELFPLCWESE
jgi:hypothetical protein